MNKSKFKTVKFKPFDMELDYQDSGVCECWTNQTAFGNSLGNDVFFTDSCIEAYPELFEVEKAEREFEDGAYYKVKWIGFDAYHVALCEIGRVKEGIATFTIPNCFPQFKEAFQEIGERIEL
jgi:hypothetical protein